MARNCFDPWSSRRRSGWSEPSDAGDLDLIDDLVHARHVANDAEDLVEHVDRFDLTGEQHAGAADGHAKVIAGRHVRGTQPLHDIGLELIVGWSLTIRGLDHVLALELTGVCRVGAGEIRTALGSTGVAHDPVAGRVVGDALLLGDQEVVGHSGRRFVDEIAAILRRQRNAVVSLFHAQG